MVQNGGMISEAESLSEQETSRCSSQMEEVASDRKGIYHSSTITGSKSESRGTSGEQEVSCYDSLLAKGKQKTKQDQLRIKEKRKDR